MREFTQPLILTAVAVSWSRLPLVPPFGGKFKRRFLSLAPPFQGIAPERRDLSAGFAGMACATVASTTGASATPTFQGRCPSSLPLKVGSSFTTIGSYPWYYPGEFGIKMVPEPRAVPWRHCDQWAWPSGGRGALFTHFWDRKHVLPPQLNH